jgi:hypothetical protein
VKLKTTAAKSADSCRKPLFEGSKLLPNDGERTKIFIPLRAPKTTPAKNLAFADFIGSENTSNDRKKLAV